jgi:hypothetical protein
MSSINLGGPTGQPGNPQQPGALPGYYVSAVPLGAQQPRSVGARSGRLLWACMLQRQFATFQTHLWLLDRLQAMGSGGRHAGSSAAVYAELLSACSTIPAVWQPRNDGFATAICSRAGPIRVWPAAPSVSVWQPPASRGHRVCGNWAAHRWHSPSHVGANAVDARTGM